MATYCHFANPYPNQKARQMIIPRLNKKWACSQIRLTNKLNERIMSMLIFYEIKTRVDKTTQESGGEAWN